MTRPLRVLMVTSELAPYAHTGGLGDVVSGLSLALAELGCDVAVVTARYNVTNPPDGARWWPEPVDVPLAAGAVVTLGVLEASVPARDRSVVRLFFVDHPALFSRDGIYGDAHGAFGDNDVRFAAMSRGALAVAGRVWPSVRDEHAGADVVHAHDWHAALSVVEAKGWGASSALAVATVLTIHNLAFQGVFGPDMLERIGFPRRAFDSGALAHDGRVNLLRGAIAAADRVTTVSPTYAREILQRRDGFGLDGVLREHTGKLVGILNGIDDQRFDPSTDLAIAARYDAASAADGKARCKETLMSELGLSGEGPLFATVSRLSEQKGIDLLLACIPGLVERGASFAIVGAGDAAIERAVSATAQRFPGRVASRIAFDGSLARRVYAGADFFVVPSRYEPCGLTQLLAMRYGAIPIVTAVGGLVDTVVPVSALHDAGTGLVAESPSVPDLLVACEDALALYSDTRSRRVAIVRGMSRDSGWRTPANEYLAVYRTLSEPYRG